MEAAVVAAATPETGGGELGSGGPFGLATASIAATISSRTALFLVDAEGSLPPRRTCERANKIAKYQANHVATVTTGFDGNVAS